MSERLEIICENMAELSLPEESFDLLWAEGSAYIIGVEKSLQLWRPFLKKRGYLVLSDLVWRTDKPSDKSIEFWSKEYPDMQLVQTRIEQMEKAGYRVIEHFSQSKEAWSNYYIPLSERLDLLEPEMKNSAAFQDIKNEVKISTQFASEFGYYMFVLENS